MGASVGGEPNSWGIGKWRAYNLGGCRGAQVVLLRKLFGDNTNAARSLWPE
jgi:hypothetical protein